jgi:hypothetical protein
MQSDGLDRLPRIIAGMLNRISIDAQAMSIELGSIAIFGCKDSTVSRPACRGRTHVRMNRPFGREEAGAATGTRLELYHRSTVLLGQLPGPKPTAHSNPPLTGRCLRKVRRNTYQCGVRLSRATDKIRLGPAAPLPCVPSSNKARMRGGMHAPAGDSREAPKARFDLALKAGAIEPCKLGERTMPPEISSDEETGIIAGPPR